MAYENTQVAVSRSQEAIRKLIMAHGGSAVAFVTQPPMEGFEAQIGIEGKTYRVRIVAEVKVREVKRQRRRWASSAPKDNEDIAARRVWRVLYFHLKSVYEAAATGVMEFRELMLPYIVANDNKTIAQHILPKLDAALAGRPERLLPSGKNDE